MEIITFLNLIFLCAGICTAGPLGKEFVTIFMQNYQPGTSNENLQVFVNGYSSTTTVTIWTSDGSIRQVYTLRERSTLEMQIPSIVLLHGIQMSRKVLIIQSDKDISVLSKNYKPQSGDVSDLLPVQDWGKEYRVLTPSLEGSKAFSVLSGAEKTSVEIHFTTIMVIENITFKPGEMFSFVLESYTAYQFISDNNLSGTRVVSQQPVAVLSGLACIPKNINCSHVFEQLQPVSMWGRTFIVPSVTSQTRPDIIYVLASHATTITHQSDLKVTSIDLGEGEVAELTLKAQAAIFISANRGILVLLYCMGEIDMSNMEHNPFLLHIPPISSYCFSFYVFGEEDSDNYGSIVAKTSYYSRITFNKRTSKQLTWFKIPGTEYSFTTIKLEKDSSFQIVDNPVSPILMLSYGIAKKSNFGSASTCMSRNIVTPCSYVKCRVKEKCQVASGKGVCVPLFQSYCWAVGGPHYRTFDTSAYDFQGTCTYTIAKTCGNDRNLAEFNIEARNENRGNNKVSYISIIKVRAYNLTITIIRYEYGFIRVNGQLQHLPVLLNNGMIRIYQSGTLLVIWTDFSLLVQFDWNSILTIYLSSSYFGNVCGLCGNFNGNPDDDLTMSTGNMAPNVTEFGKSWKTVHGNRICWDDCHGECLACSTESRKTYESKEACGLISMTTGGPFSSCHSAIDPKVYVENCVYDVCINNGQHQILCQSLKVYADVCQRNKTQIGDWRTLSGCSLQCPEYSEYKLCGSGCPKTCNDNALPTKCPHPCVETCECRTGFILDEGRCIPKVSCGCIFMGRHFDMNEKFWPDDTCEKRCLCSPATKKVECKPHKCKDSEKCGVVNGIQNCYPLTYGTCSAYGDSHYVTFDGLSYDFQGSCIYQLVGVCKNSEDLVDFHVNIQNYNKGGKIISLMTSVQVKMLGLIIVLSRQYGQQVMLNGILTNLPFTAEDGNFSIYKNGFSIVIQTRFGLLVSLSWMNRVTVKVPSTYIGTTCGLCGNFNGDSDNELVMSNNEVASTPTRFGKSWNVEDVPECSEDPKGRCLKIEEFEKLYQSSKEGCGMIRDKSGPLSQCHSTTNPKDFFKTCVFNACFYNALKDAICMVIANYVAACQEARAIVSPWRLSNFCSPVCGDNSHYDVCAPGCSPSCPSLSPPSGCNVACSEGCVCDDGYVLSGGDCVPISQCGCTYLGKYYKVGEVFLPDRLCSEQCVCAAVGAVNCKAFSCGITKECTVVDGVQKCQPIVSARCSVAGHAHYMSFDELYFNFQSTCTYTLVKLVTSNSSLIPFEIKVKKQQWANTRVSVTKTVVFDVYGYTLILQHNTAGQVLVNGVIYNLPLILEDEKIQVYQHGLTVEIDTDFGVKVSYDLFYHVLVTVSGIYKGQMGGLCGNYNDDKRDEFQQPNRTLAPDVISFGASWKVDIPGETCNPSCGGQKAPCPSCDVRRIELFKADHYCGILKKVRGPLSACFETINPDNYFNSCLFDLCASPEIIDILCHSIQRYVSTCQEAGVALKPWRTKAFCREYSILDSSDQPQKALTCPANSHYKVCSDVCTSSCARITKSIQCPVPCLEGCQCDEKFHFNGRNCVPIDKCGCFVKGKYYQLLETVLLNDCKTSCTCNATNTFSCKNTSCATDQRCQNVNGVIKCVSQDPCKSTKCRLKETCKVEKGSPVCVPDYTGTCYAYGDPHFHTYDGRNFDFQGTCTYVLSKYFGNDSTLVPFSIEEKNDNRGSQAVSFVRTVNVYIYGYKVSILKGESGNIRVNDVLTNLPVTLLDGKITISMSGFSAVVRTDVGLQVAYDYNWHVGITLPSSYFGATGGLCANFNQDAGDELVTSDNRRVTSIDEWAISWKVNDKDEFCWDVCPGICPSCDELDKSLYESDIFCGIIRKGRDGPFRECHANTDPEIFFNNCVFDVCVYGGAKQILCQALNAYAKTCRSQGAKIYDWRTPSNCAPTCPENSYFEFCGSSCPATCSLPTVPVNCPGPCVETCQCEDGFIFSADKCVPRGSCGCQYKNAYYHPDQQFWEGDSCHSLCKCDSSSGFVQCVSSNCTEEERCAVVNGVRGCQPRSFSTCSVKGGSHYTTFDGKSFDFMGDCVYQLVGVTSNDSSPTPYTVLTENINRGSSAVSRPKLVSVLVYGMVLTPSVDFTSRILINGVATALPFYYQGNKVVVYISGGQCVIKTDFDLTVTFDWSSSVSVTVPSTYANAVGGLCGNNNQNPDDDFTMKNGGTASSAVQFANSWKVADTEGCSAECTGNCPQCSDAQKEEYKVEKYCGIIIKATGPFKECYSVIDPAPYFKDCVFDTCQYGGHPSSFCAAIGLYVSACQAAGVRVREWRSEASCPKSCLGNSHYELCGSGCAATCYGLSVPAGCITQCKEGCYCDNGFILSGHTCLPISDCGCVYKDRYYQKYQVFYPDDKCNVSCRCQENGIVTCEKAPCGQNAECRVVKGVRGCYGVGYRTCVAYGDSHYVTFDGHHYQFYGTCTYTLSEAANPPFPMPTFSIVLENKPLQKASVSRSVSISVYDYTVTIKGGLAWQVKVDGIVNNLPLTLSDDAISINQEGNNIILQTNFGLLVLVDTVNFVLINVPTSYTSSMVGLCGNFNGNQQDDFQLPSNEVTTNVETFGASWKVNNSNVNCQDDCRKQCPPCDEADIKPCEASTACGIMKNYSGPFKECHKTVNPDQYVSACTYDMCVSSGSNEVLCRSLQAYTAACQKEGANVSLWRTPTLCPFTCPASSHYKLCSLTCARTCSGLTSPRTCTNQCFEGCECIEGFLFDGDRCVRMQKCGCIFNGEYLKDGEGVVTVDCKLRCVCQVSVVICTEITCGVTERCEIRNGIRNCHVPLSECSVSATRFVTFDGLSGDPIAPGCYDMTAYSDSDSDSWFRVIAHIQSCSNQVPSVARLHIFLNNSMITVTKRGEIWANGRSFSPKVQPSGVSFTRGPTSINLVIAKILTLELTKSGGLTLSAGSELRGSLSGTCGNYNGDTDDDLLDARGEETPSINVMIESWEARDFCSCDTQD